MANDSTPTRAVEPDRPTPRATRGGITGTEYQLGATRLSVDISASPPASADREAILASLYEERRKLTRAKRLGEMAQGDEEYLAELNQYIDRWEAHEARSTRSDDVWQRLEDLAASMLAVQAKVERHQR